MANNEVLLTDVLSPEEADNLQTIGIIRTIHEDIAELDLHKRQLEEASQALFEVLFDGLNVLETETWDNTVNLGKLYFLVESLLKRGNETTKAYEQTELNAKIRLLFGQYRTDRVIEYVINRLTEEQFMGYADGFKIRLLGVSGKSSRLKYRHSWFDGLG